MADHVAVVRMPLDPHHVAVFAVGACVLSRGPSFNPVQRRLSAWELPVQITCIALHLPPRSGSKTAAGSMAMATTSMTKTCPLEKYNPFFSHFDANPVWQQKSSSGQEYSVSHTVWSVALLWASKSNLSASSANSRCFCGWLCLCLQTRVVQKLSSPPLFSKQPRISSAVKVLSGYVRKTNQRQKWMQNPTHQNRWGLFKNWLPLQSNRAAVKRSKYFQGLLWRQNKGESERNSPTPQNSGSEWEEMVLTNEVSASNHSSFAPQWHDHKTASKCRWRHLSIGGPPGEGVYRRRPPKTPDYSPMCAFSPSKGAC